MICNRETMAPLNRCPKVWLVSCVTSRLLFDIGEVGQSDEHEAHLRGTDFVRLMFSLLRFLVFESSPVLKQKDLR